MQCKHCHSTCQKVGKQKNGTQKWYCKKCHKYQQSAYLNNACKLGVEKEIKSHLKEGCGIRSIARLLGISPTTVIKRIKKISSQISKPPNQLRKRYEMDEIQTYVGKKKQKVWIAYAIQQDTREVVDFQIGRRNTKTLNKVIETLLQSSAIKIYTDKLNIYPSLIDKTIHSIKNRGINYIERKNLTLRTHLKRLNRRSICYSRSVTMLEASLRIYFWG